MGGGTFDQNHVMTSLDDCEMGLFFCDARSKTVMITKKGGNHKKVAITKNGGNHKKNGDIHLLDNCPPASLVLDNPEPAEKIVPNLQQQKMVFRQLQNIFSPCNAL